MSSKKKTKAEKELEKLRKKLPKKTHKGTYGGAADDLKINPKRFSGDKGIRRAVPSPANRVNGFGTV